MIKVAFSGTQTQRTEQGIQDRANFLGISSLAGNEIARLVEQPSRRSAEERQRFHEVFELIVRGADIEIGMEIEENEYAIAAMQHGPSRDRAERDPMLPAAGSRGGMIPWVERWGLHRRAARGDRNRGRRR